MENIGCERDEGWQIRIRGRELDIETKYRGGIGTWNLTLIRKTICSVRIKALPFLTNITPDQHVGSVGLAMLKYIPGGAACLRLRLSELLRIGGRLRA